MSHATSASAGGVVLDWRHTPTGPPAPCVLCGGPAVCRSPVKGVPCHKMCAEAWITVHAADAHQRALLIRAHTPRQAMA